MVTFKDIEKKVALCMESLKKQWPNGFPERKRHIIFSFQFPLLCIIYWRLGGHTTIKEYMPLGITDSISI